MTEFMKELDIENQENSTCPYEMCDGSGVVMEGEYDDVRERQCLCAKPEVDYD